MRFTVIGDVLLDEDLDGSSVRHCPDAPTAPVVDLESRRVRAGGAGLVARMLAADGHDVTLLTALSTDSGGDVLRECLAGIEIISCDSEAPTPVKTRLRSDQTTLCRVDEACARPPIPSVTEALLDAVRQASTIVVADYGRRLLEHPALREAIARQGEDCVVVWDPHPLGSDPVASVTLTTPNLAEAATAAGLPLVEESAGPAAASLRERYGCAAVAVTLGENGAMVAAEGASPHHLPTTAVDTSDPCGAGDRFAASAAVALQTTGDTASAVAAAVAAARDYLAAGGIAAFGQEVVRASSGRAAAVARSDDAFLLVRAVREQGGRVVAAGGCFDLLHAGHIRTLQAARALGDCLIVVMNSDESVRRLKGPERPIVDQRHRAEMLRALTCVDDVLVFDEDTPERALEQLRPDLWVKGGDYRVETLPETALLERWGGSVVALPYHLGHSTTRLVETLAQVS